MEELRAALAPWHPYVKAVHVIAAAVWAFSTAVAWVMYLKPALRRAARAPDDAEARARRDRYLELFDRGAIGEHVALAVLVVTALALLWLGRVDLGRWSFVTAKLWIGILVIAPMEAVDIYLSHLGGNKAGIRRTGDTARDGADRGGDRAAAVRARDREAVLMDTLPVWDAPPPRSLRRSLAAVWRQRARSVCCPESARLDGKLALVTGGNAGIGLATSGGLTKRGADVVVACRRETKDAHWLPLDLADLASVRAAADRLASEARRPVDVLIANAGLWPERHAVSPQGHEIAFATNVLGHFALVRALELRGLLPAARVVVVTGDIYAGARACTPDFTYRGRFGGADAYRRSKLGNLWLARELARRRPALRVVAVHPGVVASDLVRGFGALKRRLLLDCEAGAQASLLAATHPGLASGSYVHNTGGVVRFHPDDPAEDAAGAAALWDFCEAAARPFF